MINLHRVLATVNVVFGMVFGTAGSARAAATVTPDEIRERDQWVQEHLTGGAPPFTFVFDGHPSTNLLSQWSSRTKSKRLSHRRAERTLTWTDRNTGLEVRCVSVEYADFPVVEWIVHLRNTSKKDTPILENIQAIDSRIEKTDGSEFLLRGNRWDGYKRNSYEPYQKTLGPGTRERLGVSGEMPYYNLAIPGGGLILAVGWWGGWEGGLARDNGNGLRMTAGQRGVRLYLQPGEEIRTPLVALLFWKGSDPVRAQNVWRRWLLAHAVPKPGGKPLQPILWNCNGGLYRPGLETDAAGELDFLRRYQEEGIKVDAWLQDAAWYPCAGDYMKMGTWEPDAKRWPKGIREVSDWCHAHGLNTIVWFSPERVTPDTWLANNHPKWLLGGEKIRENGYALLNLGNPDALHWLIDHIDKLMTEQGIDVYRQDHIMGDPVPFWQANDATNRQGISEIKYVSGFMAFWDELRRRHPKMLIDSNNRSDLETLHRAVLLNRSDYAGDPVAQQNYTYGLSSWVPYYSSGSGVQDVYLVRSLMSPAMGVGADMRRKDLDYDLLRKLIAQWREVAPYYLGDYYPLTAHSTSNDVWMAWQFNRPEQGDGVVQAFRRADNGETTRTLRLFDLEPESQYELTDFDKAMPRRTKGKELMEQGLAIEIRQKPGAVVIKYRKL